MTDAAANRGHITVSLAAIEHNVQTLRSRVPDAQIMAIVKANAYGHGRDIVVPAAHRAGIRWFGVAHHTEALETRQILDNAGIARSDAQMFSWIAPSDGDWDSVVDADIDVSASTLDDLRAISKTRGCANVHLKVDVGMSRAGALPHEFEALAEHAKSLQDAGALRVVGIWSHLPQADDPQGAGASITKAQLEVFQGAIDSAKEVGLEPTYRHIAATAATLWHPESHFDLVRVGIGLYGLSPEPAHEDSTQLGLIPAMKLSAPLRLVKRLPAGATVSYGGTWRADVPTWVGLVPLGYADGVPRLASNKVSVAVETANGTVASRVLGRICMDQFMINLGTGPQPLAEVGDEAVLFGPAPDVPYADDWASAIGTINYEIVARMSSELPRLEVEHDL